MFADFSMTLRGVKGTWKAIDKNHVEFWYKKIKHIVEFNDKYGRVATLIDPLPPPEVERKSKMRLNEEFKKNRDRTIDNTNKNAGFVNSSFGKLKRDADKLNFSSKSKVKRLKKLDPLAELERKNPEEAYF